MRAKDIMTTPVVTATSTTSLKGVGQLLVQHDISAVPIVDEAGSLIGLVSEADIVPFGYARVLGATGMTPPEGHGPRVASDVMAINVATVPEDADVTAVARLMQYLRVRHVPVVAGTRVTGIISRRDILKILTRSDASIEAELQDILDDQTMLLGRLHATVAGGVVTLSGPGADDGTKLAAIIARGIPGVVAVRFEHDA